MSAKPAQKRPDPRTVWVMANERVRQSLLAAEAAYRTAEAIINAPVRSSYRSGPARPQARRGPIDTNPVARAVASGIAANVGRAVGATRAAKNSAQGLIEGAAFLGRLPFDERAREEVKAMGEGVINALKEGLADPGAVIDHGWQTLREANRNLNPAATPAAATLAEEMQRQFSIGRNQGAAAFNVSTAVVGGPAAKSVGAIAGARAASAPAKFLAQGFKPEVAAYLAEPYAGMGSHFIPRRIKLLPPTLRDGPYNVLRPPGISRGDMYEEHFKNDPYFHGARLPPELQRIQGSGWRGKDLGLERYGRAGRLWHGSPAPLKARIGGSTATAGSIMYDDENGEHSK